METAHEKILLSVFTSVPADSQHRLSVPVSQTTKDVKVIQPSIVSNSGATDDSRVLWLSKLLIIQSGSSSLIWHIHITWKQAEYVLSGKSDGTFLIRKEIEYGRPIFDISSPSINTHDICVV